MSYFDITYYNEDNLIKKDRAKIDFWRSTFESAIEKARFDLVVSLLDNYEED